MEYFEQLSYVYNHLEFSVDGNTEENASCSGKIISMIRTLEKNKIIVIGNGGSASIASHAATDLMKNCNKKAICFSDYSLLTCFSNDYGYENAYSEMLKLMGEEGDILIAISSSGSSDNILNAVKMAKEKGLNVITLSGFSSENDLRKMGSINIFADSNHYGHVELAHQIFMHKITDGVKYGE